MRIALVHDWLNQNGGAERVLEVLHGMYPDAPIFTSVYAPDRLPAAYREWDIRTSFMQRLPLVHRYHQPFLPLYPLAFQSWRFDDFDVVISNSSGFSHGIPVPPGVVHINYCLTPPRFLWMPESYLAREQVPGLLRALAGPSMGPLRRWDAASVRGISHFVAISEAVRERIQRYYGREATIIYPPVDTQSFYSSNQTGDFYFIASRLVPYKRVDLAVQAFTRLGLPLVIVGDGRDRGVLQAMAGPTVRFEGRVSEQRLRELYATCKAFIFPGEEDFGIAPLEAQASGRPVIAYHAGGALDTIVDGVTGVFFDEPAVASLMEAVRRSESLHFDPAAARENAARFDTQHFVRQLSAFVAEHTGAKAQASFSTT